MYRILISAAGALALAGSAHAQSGTITFIGQIVEQTCVVQPRVAGTDAGRDFIVGLPDVARQQLAAAGARGPHATFELVVGSPEHPCGQSQVEGRFATMGDTTVAGRLGNRGSASHIEVVVMDAQGADVDLANPGSAQRVKLEDGIGRLQWQAAYVASAPVSAGNVMARVQYLVDYP